MQVTIRCVKCELKCAEIRSISILHNFESDGKRGICGKINFKRIEIRKKIAALERNVCMMGEKEVGFFYCVKKVLLCRLKHDLTLKC